MVAEGGARAVEGLGHGEQGEPLRWLGEQGTRSPAQQLRGFSALGRPCVVGGGDESAQIGVQHVLDVAEQNVDHAGSRGVTRERAEQVLRSLTPPDVRPEVEQRAGEGGLVVGGVGHPPAGRPQCVAERLVEQAVGGQPSAGLDEEVGRRPDRELSERRGRDVGRVQGRHGPLPQLGGETRCLGGRQGRQRVATRQLPHLRQTVHEGAQHRRDVRGERDIGHGGLLFVVEAMGAGHQTRDEEVRLGDLGDPARHRLGHLAGLVRVTRPLRPPQLQRRHRVGDQIVQGEVALLVQIDRDRGRPEDPEQLAGVVRAAGADQHLGAHVRAGHRERHQHPGDDGAGLVRVAGLVQGIHHEVEPCPGAFGEQRPQPGDEVVNLLRERRRRRPGDLHRHIQGGLALRVDGARHRPDLRPRCGIVAGQGRADLCVGSGHNPTEHRRLPDPR